MWARSVREDALEVTESSHEPVIDVKSSGGDGTDGAEI
jgi:hypothetical protein